MLFVALFHAVSASSMVKFLTDLNGTISASDVYSPDEPCLEFFMNEYCSGADPLAASAEPLSGQIFQRIWYEDDQCSTFYSVNAYIVDGSCDGFGTSCTLSNGDVTRLVYNEYNCTGEVIETDVMSIDSLNNPECVYSDEYQRYLKETLSVGTRTRPLYSDGNYKITYVYSSSDCSGSPFYATARIDFSSNAVSRESVECTEYDSGSFSTEYPSATKSINASFVEATQSKFTGDFLIAATHFNVDCSDEVPYLYEALLMDGCHKYLGWDESFGVTFSNGSGSYKYYWYSADCLYDTGLDIIFDNSTMSSCQSNTKVMKYTGGATYNSTDQPSSFQPTGWYLSAIIAGAIALVV